MDTTPNDRPIDHIRELTRNWSPGQFERSYAPGKWTARQILIHLAQTEIGLGNRARMALTSPQYTAQPFDHEAWVARETSLSGQATVEALTGLNRMNQSFFASLSRAELSTPLHASGLRRPYRRMDCASAGKSSDTSPRAVGADRSCRGKNWIDLRSWHTPQPWRARR
jgi:hypothetical protein